MVNHMGNRGGIEHELPRITHVIICSALSFVLQMHWQGVGIPYPYSTHTVAIV